MSRHALRYDVAACQLLNFMQGHCCAYPLVFMQHCCTSGNDLATLRPSYFPGAAGLLCGSRVLAGAGPCTRCEMVCTDQQTGRVSGSEPLLTLAAFRRRRGRIMFGLLLRRGFGDRSTQRHGIAQQPAHLAVGMPLHGRDDGDTGRLKGSFG